MRHLIAVIISLSWLVAPMPGTAEAKGSYFAIVVSDIRTSSAWYESVLGLEVSARMSESGKFEIVPSRDEWMPGSSVAEIRGSSRGLGSAPRDAL